MAECGKKRAGPRCRSTSWVSMSEQNTEQIHCTARRAGEDSNAKLLQTDGDNEIGYETGRLDQRKLKPSA